MNARGATIRIPVMAPLAFVLVACASHAGGFVGGVVVDSLTGRPIRYATEIGIRQLETGDPRLPVRTAADRCGRFRIDGVVPGRYEVAVRAVGFRSATVTIDATTVTPTIRLALRRAPAPTGDFAYDDRMIARIGSCAERDSRSAR